MGLLLHKICRSKEIAELINICPLGYFLSNKKDKIKMCTMCIYVCVCTYMYYICIYITYLFFIFIFIDALSARSEMRFSKSIPESFPQISPTFAFPACPSAALTDANFPSSVRVSHTPQPHLLVLKTRNDS